MRRKVRHLYPRQDEKAALVGDEPDVGLSLLFGPTDVSVAWPEVASGRRPAEACDGLPASGHEILEVLTDRMGVPEIMVLLDERLDESLVRSATNLTDVEGPEIRKTRGERRSRHIDQSDHGVAARLLAPPSSRRQIQVALPVKFQHQSTTERVAWRTVLLRPVPRLAYLERERSPTRSGAPGNELPKERDLARSERASAIAKHRVGIHDRDLYRRSR
jgi:hypothetical protein